VNTYLALQPHVRSDEQPLWHGAPDPRVWFAPADTFLIPFSILWCGFAIFWEAGVVAGGGPVFFSVVGIPFIAIGIYAPPTASPPGAR